MNTTTQLLLNFLVNAAWQICLIALVAWLAERLTRSLNRIRHLVWVLALLAAFLLPAWSAVRTLKPPLVRVTSVEAPLDSTPTLVVGVPQVTSPSSLPPRRHCRLVARTQKHLAPGSISSTSPENDCMAFAPWENLRILTESGSHSKKMLSRQVGFTLR